MNQNNKTIHVTFIHGIANKPDEKSLLDSWNKSLSDDFNGNLDGIDLAELGITSSMIYWADVLYDSPLQAAVIEVIQKTESLSPIATPVLAVPDEQWRELLTGKEKLFVESLARSIGADVSEEEEPSVISVGALERIPLPWFLKKPLMARVLRDVHHYLFNVNFCPRNGVHYQVRDEIRSRVIAKLSAVKADIHIVVTHSMGTVIAYDCLKRVENCPAISGLMTIGSPLGLDEIQDQLSPEWTRRDGFPDKLKGRWINVYDGLDPVACLDGNIANDFRKNGIECIEVVRESNRGMWRHDIGNYLSMPLLRVALRKLINGE